jgi:hypothetical protein
MTIRLNHIAQTMISQAMGGINMIDFLLTQ